MSELQARSKEVQFNGKPVTVRELTLGDIMGVGKALSSIASRADIFDAFKSEDTDKQAVAISELLVMLPQDMAELIQLATGLKPEKVIAATPAQVLDLVLEIWELNNLVDIFGKKLSGVLGKISAAPKVANPPLDKVTPPPLGSP